MKTRVITALVGIAVLVLVMLTFNTMIFNLVVAAVALIGMHEVYAALGFERKDWLLYAVLVPYTLLVMLSSYQSVRGMVMAVSFALMLFYCIYLVIRNGSVSYQKVSGLILFSGIILFCFYSLIHLKVLLPVEQYSYDAIFFILLILCFAWGGDTCAYFAGRAFGKHKLCPKVSPKKTVEGAIGGVLGTMLLHRDLYPQQHRGVHVPHHRPAGGGGCGAGHLRRPVRQRGQASVRHQGLWHHLPRPRRHPGPV